MFTCFCRAPPSVDGTWNLPGPFTGMCVQNYPNKKSIKQSQIDLCVSSVIFTPGSQVDLDQLGTKIATLLLFSSGVACILKVSLSNRNKPFYPPVYPHICAKNHCRKASGQLHKVRFIREKENFMG